MPAYANCRLPRVLNKETDYKLTATFGLVHVEILPLRQVNHQRGSQVAIAIENVPRGLFLRCQTWFQFDLNFDFLRLAISNEPNRVLGTGFLAFDGSL